MERAVEGINGTAKKSRITNLKFVEKQVQLKIIKKE